MERTVPQRAAYVRWGTGEDLHHKQLFFSDNPIFVEGILDARLVGTIQEARGVSVAGAGSCIIDAGGCEEVNRYLELCTAFGKRAHFLYDLDSLFRGSLRACVGEDESVQGFIVTAGLGRDFAKYCGQLDKALRPVIDQVLSATTSAPSLKRLKGLFDGLGNQKNWDKESWAKARVSMMTAISKYRSEVVATTSESNVSDVEGRMKQITTALKQKNVNLLPGGTLERYLPAYAGDDYELSDRGKRDAVDAEIEHLATSITETELAMRYGDLYQAVASLPAKMTVDVERVLRDYLSRYIHDLQKGVTSNLKWQKDELQGYLNNVQKATARLFSVAELVRGEHKEFGAIVSVSEMLGQKQRFVRVTHQTNSGMGDFTLESEKPLVGKFTNGDEEAKPEESVPA